MKEDDTLKEMAANEHEVLLSTINSMHGMTKPMVDQAAAMMIQNMQSFLHRNEQVLTIAIAKASAMMLNDNTAEAGQKALGAYAKMLNDLSKYSTDICISANKIITDFKG